MAHVVGIWAEKTGAFVARFFSEVVASVVTTACVAGATTLYIHYTAIAPQEPPAPPKAETADIATLLSPVADPAAPRFIAVAVDTSKKPPGLPPARPRAIDKVMAKGGDKSVESFADKPVEIATHHVAEVPAEPESGFDDGPSAMSAADIRARDSLFGPPPEGMDALQLVDAPQTRRPAAFASAASAPILTRPADRRLLGVPVPDALPSGEDVANRVKGWGAAVGSLIP